MIAASAPAFPVELEPGGFDSAGRPRPPAFMRCSYKCARCSTGGPHYVSLAQATEAIRERHSLADGLDEAQAKGVVPTEAELHAYARALTWSLAGSSGFRLNARTGRPVCGGQCDKDETHQAGDVSYSVDASRNPHDPRLRQHAVPPKATGAIKPAGGVATSTLGFGAQAIEEKHESVRCGSCEARIDIRQRRPVGTEEFWEPSAEKQYANAGWLTRAGTPFCGRFCADRSGIREGDTKAPLPAVLDVPDQSYQRARAIALAPPQFVRPPLMSHDPPKPGPKPGPRATR